MRSFERCETPYERYNPSDECPTEKEVQYRYRCNISMMSLSGNDCRQEIDRKQKYQYKSKGYRACYP